MLTLPLTIPSISCKKEGNGVSSPELADTELLILFPRLPGGGQKVTWLPRLPGDVPEGHVDLFTLSRHVVYKQSPRGLDAMAQSTDPPWVLCKPCGHALTADRIQRSAQNNSYLSVCHESGAITGRVAGLVGAEQRWRQVPSSSPIPNGPASLCVRRHSMRASKWLSSVHMWSWYSYRVSLWTPSCRGVWVSLFGCQCGRVFRFAFLLPTVPMSVDWRMCFCPEKWSMCFNSSAVGIMTRTCMPISSCACELLWKYTN